MKLKKLIISVVALFPLMPAVRVWAASPLPDVLIVELQVRSDASTGAADQEFIELYNTTDQPINMSTWKLQYKSATGSTWSDKATLHGSLDAHSHYLLVSDKFPNPPTTVLDEPALALDVFKAGLNDSSGHVRIADFIIPAAPIVHDLLGWGTTANAAEGNAPATAPAGGKSLQRKSLDANFIDTDKNGSDFEISSSPSPQADPLFVAPVHNPDPTSVSEPDTEVTTPDPEPTPAGTSPSDASSQSDDQPETVVPPTRLPPQISELLPNPASPATDSADEFIELYNPNDQALDLKDYKLQSGNTFSYSYTFGVLTLAAHEYRAFFVTQTSDILSNTSGQSRLMDPAGTVVAQTNVYDAAPDGQAWAFMNGAWQWTTTPTPNEPNALTTEPLKTVGIIKPSTSKTTASKATAKTAAVPKPKTSASVKSAKTTASPDRQVYQDPAAAPTNIHPGILAGVGVITLLYALYEYRHDMVNTLRRFQRYRDVRRAARPSSSGR